MVVSTVGGIVLILATSCELENIKGNRIIVHI